MMAMEQYIPGGDSTHIVELTFASTLGHITRSMI